LTGTGGGGRRKKERKKECQIVWFHFELFQQGNDNGLKKDWK
jgi:hypothetical protein